MSTSCLVVSFTLSMVLFPSFPHSSLTISIPNPHRQKINFLSSFILLLLSVNYYKTYFILSLLFSFHLYPTFLPHNPFLPLPLIPPSQFLLTSNPYSSFTIPFHRYPLFLPNNSFSPLPLIPPSQFLLTLTPYSSLTIPSHLYPYSSLTIPSHLSGIHLELSWVESKKVEEGDHRSKKTIIDIVHLTLLRKHLLTRRRMHECTISLRFVHY